MSTRVFGRSLPVFTGLMIGQLLLTLFLSSTLNIWVDEYFSLYATGESLARAIRQSIQFDYQPPLYYLVLTLWRLIDSSVFFARLLSVVSVALATVIFYRLLCRMWSRDSILLLFPLIVFNPYLIWAACEIRLYGLLLLECALTMFLFYEGFLRDDRRPPVAYKLFFFVLSLALLYTQYYAGFLLAAAGVALVMLKRWREVKWYVGGMFVVGVLFLPMVSILAGQMSDVGHTASAAGPAPGIAASLKHVYWQLQGLLFPDTGIEGWAAVKDWSVRLMLLYLVFLGVRYRASIVNPPTIYLFTLVAVLTGSFVLISLRLGLFYTQQRHLAILFFPLLGLLLGLFCLARQKWARWACLVFFLAVYTGGLTYNYIPPVKNGDWKRIADYLAGSNHRSAPILVFRNEGALPLSTYCGPETDIVPVPRAAGLERFDVRTSVIQSEQMFGDIVEDLGDRSRVFWLLTYATGAWLGTDIGADIVEHFVDTHCTVIEQRKFVGTTVRLLKYHGVVSTGKKAE